MFELHTAAILENVESHGGGAGRPVAIPPSAPNLCVSMHISPVINKALKTPTKLTTPFSCNRPHGSVSWHGAAAPFLADHSAAFVQPEATHQWPAG